MKRTVAIVVGLGLLAWVGWGVHRRIQQAAAAKESGRRRGAVPVEAMAVRRGLIRDVRVLSGSLRPAAEFLVAPKVAGRLESLTVDIGSPVQRGQKIGSLESEEYRQRVEQARAELAVAMANVAQTRSSLEVVRREFERVDALRGKQVASESELDSAQARLDTAEANLKVTLAQVTQREAALRAAEVQLSYTQIVALWEEQAGEAPRVIGERFVDQGAMLKANDPIVSVVALDPCRAIVHVTEREYPAIRIGQEATVACDAFPGREFAGRIARVAPLLKESSREARVELDVPNPEVLLRPGMFVRVRLELARREAATLVPVHALARRGNRQGVFRVDAAAGTARFVPVRLGIVAGEDAEVVEPADLDGSVVVLGQHLLEDGGAILLPPAAGAAEAASPASAEPSAPPVPAGAGGRG